MDIGVIVLIVGGVLLLWAAFHRWFWILGSALGTVCLAFLTIAYVVHFQILYAMIAFVATVGVGIGCCWIYEQ